MTTSVRVNEIMCFSNDGKRAKYRLIDAETHGMFYCSKCAISLVQEGYQVEEICSSSKVDVARRRQECQDLVRKLDNS